MSATSMLLIKGTFRAAFSAPDGDTIHFLPDNVADWKLVPGVNRVLPKGDGRAPIRLESIDALETHYGDKDSPSGVQHQPLNLAHQARDELLASLGFTNVVRDGEFVKSTTPDAVPGFILTRGADIFGRCVALVSKTFPPVFNGYETEVDEDLLKKTANYHMIDLGLAYPTYYAAFPDHLRASLTVAAREARNARKGVWAKDATTEGAKVTGMDSLTAETGAVILPKLFRRLKDYLDLNPADPSLACFPAFLAGNSDKFYIQGNPKQFTGMHNIVEIANGQTVKMTHQAEEITFDEK
ncbi:MULTISPECIES: thermonuclease family protein [unclassified Streptomyces]|uniref:thermonuclease family protein n=1 Tax=unclassified Streptomyces TaxID=2593676 RepID=UPI002E261B88|nr:nuclease [Streptomyces sp. NBC_01001]